MGEREPMLPLSDSQREFLNEATERYAADSLDVWGYLNARGIDPATAAEFKLGYVKDPLPGHERFQGYLAIPYLGHDGRTLSLRFRCIQDHEHVGHGKYMSPPGEQGRLYNVRALVDAQEEIAITEGELDCVILNMVGIPAVGLPGATHWRPHYPKMFAGHSRVWVFGDPDEAGGEMVNKITRSLRQAKPVRLKDGDVTDTYLAGGAEALRGLLES